MGVPETAPVHIPSLCGDQQAPRRGLAKFYFLCCKTHDAGARLSGFPHRLWEVVCSAIENNETTRRMDVIWDLSHKMENYQPRFATHTQFFRMMWNRLEDGDRSAHAQLILGEHSGTHVDAPCHFFMDAKTIDEIPLDHFMGPGRCIDARNVGPGETVSPRDIIQYERVHGSLSSGDVVLFCFGFGARWGVGKAGRRYTAAWPGVSVDVAEILVKRNVKAVGTDAISIDVSGDSESPAHHVLLGAEILVYENLADLDKVVDHRFQFYGVPLRIGEGTGSPVRAWAMTV